MARAGSTRTGSASDPLAELARLLGQSELPGSAGSRARARDETDPRPPTRKVVPSWSDQAAEPRAARNPAPPTGEDAGARPPAWLSEQARAPRGPVRAPDPTPVRRSEPRTAESYPEPDAYPPESDQQSDQRYGGYTEPSPEPPARSSRAAEPGGWPNSPRQMGAPFPQAEPAGWRPPRPRNDVARQDEPPASYGLSEPGNAAAGGRYAAAPEPVYPADEQPVYAEPEPAYEDDPRYAPASDGAYEAGEYVDEQNEGYAPAPDNTGYQYQPRLRTRPNSLLIAGAILAFAVVGTAGAYSYRLMIGAGTRNSAPPVIRADSVPKKIASAAPGSADKQIYERLGDRGQNERVVPREEQPVTIRDPSPRIQPGTDTTSNLPPSVSAPATVPAGSNAPAGEPKRIRTVTIRPEGEADVAPAQAPAASAPAQARPAAPAAATAPTAAPARNVRPATPAASSGGPMPIVPQAAQPAAAPTRTALASPPPSDAGKFVVQVASQKTAEEARAAFRAMQEKYPSVLSGQPSLVKKKDIAGKGTFYGSQVGPFASREDAVQLCERLKAAGGMCFIQRN